MLSLVLLGLFLWAIGYLLFCLVSPYRNCATCNGSSRVTGSFNSVRPCTRCDSAGLQLRPGRRFINAYRDTRRRNRNRF